MDFSKNIINKPTQPKLHKITKPMSKLPAGAGKKVGGSPERVNLLTGMKVKDDSTKAPSKISKAKPTPAIKNPNNPAGQKEESKIVANCSGKMVGKNVDHSKWRCKTCKFLNDINETA
mmetsp:Transcript_23081/g.26462  ORF Transcript_23081/g.26462 Transcript_23081/m.26462 type:complete len:118 (+) Transcript_23081:1-354(+)